MKKIVIGIGTVLVILSLIFYSNAMDKKNNYVSPDSPHAVNAYVGGDAYNLIINGTYFVGYSALSAGTMVSGIILLIEGHKKS